MKFLKKILIFSIFLIFFLSLTNLQIGGDDSKLYYYFPWEYIKNFSSKIISDNQAGSLGIYFSQTYTYPSIKIISILSKIFNNNTIKIVFFINSFLSFIFFKKFLGEIYLKSDFLKTLISLLYSFSIFTYYTVWSHQLLALFLTSFFPIFLYLLSKYINTGNILNIFLLIISFVIYSFSFYSIPWILATLIVLFPYLLFFFKIRKKLLINSLLFLFVSILFLNLHWLFPFIYSPFSSSLKTDIISQSQSSDMTNANTNNIKQISHHNSLLYPITNLYHKSIQKDFGWKTLDVFKNYYENNILINFSIISIISFAYIRIKNDQDKKLFLTALSSWLMSLYFFTVNIGDWGLPLFLKFNKYIPGFAMFRNMYDKFGIGMAISTSLILGISSSTILKNINKKINKNIFLGFLSLLVLFNIYPFVKGDLFKLSYGNTTKLYNRLTDTKEQINNILFEFKELESDSKVLWWPLNTANYVVIKDQYTDHQVYAGVSPLSLLTPHQDFNGLLSFNNIQRKKIKKYIERKEYDNLGKIFQTLNVGYIALNNFNDENIEHSYLYTVAIPGDFYDLQVNEELLGKLLGEKIIDVENYYSLYYINNNYRNKKIFLTDEYNFESTSSADLTYKKNASHLYKINISNLTEKTKLVFLDPYHDKWQLYKDNQLSKPMISGSHDFIFDYANGWVLDPDVIGENIEISLYFQPYDYFWPMIYLSFSTFIIVLILFIFYLFKQKHENFK